MFTWHRASLLTSSYCTAWQPPIRWTVELNDGRRSWTSWSSVRGNRSHGWIFECFFIVFYGCFGCVLVAAFPPKMITKATDFSICAVLGATVGSLGVGLVLIWVLFSFCQGYGGKCFGLKSTDNESENEVVVL